MADSSEPLTQAAVRAEWLALQAARLCGEHREDDAIEVCDEALREDHLCDYALLVRDHACRMELSHAEQLTVEALTSAAKGRFAVALELAKEALKLDDGYECAHRIREFVARARKHGHSNYAAETHKHALKPLKAEAGETKKPVYSETMDDMTAQIHAVAADALKRGLSIEEFREAIEAKLTAKAQAAARETTARAKGRPRRLKWNKDALPGEDPATFAWRAYQAEAKAGTLHRGLIGQEDKALAVKLANWLRTHDMAEGIDIPTLPEWNTRQLAKLQQPDARAVLRLAAVERKRRERVAALG